MFVFDAHAVEVAIGLCGGTLFTSRDGVITASVAIPCAETLSQVSMMGQPRHLRPANNLVIFDARFKSLDTTAMAVGGNLKAAKTRRRSLVRGYDLLDSSVEWLSADLWQCPICSWCNLHGMLRCICCESICLFQREGYPCAFTPVGRQALITSYAMVHPTNPLGESGSDGVQQGDHLADPSASLGTNGKHEYTICSSLKN